MLCCRESPAERRAFETLDATGHEAVIAAGRVGIICSIEAGDE